MAVGRVNIIRIVLDTIMAGTIIILMDLQITGLVLHEAIGLILYLLFVLHKFINRKWIIGVSRAFFKKLPLKTRLNYVLDLFMLAGLTLIVLSGAFIARTITWLPGDGAHIWKEIHIISALVVFGIVGVHVGLHFRFIIQGLIKMAKAIFISNDKKSKPALEIGGSSNE